MNYEIRLNNKYGLRYNDPISSVKIPVWVMDSHRNEIIEKVLEWLKIETKIDDWTEVEVIQALNKPKLLLPFKDFALLYDFKQMRLYRRELNLVLAEIYNLFFFSSRDDFLRV